MSRKFKHWAYLNKEGMEFLGEVFPDRTVPVLSMIWKTGSLGSPDIIQDYFTVQWDELTKEQQNTILDILSKKFGATKGQLKEQIFALGMPLRRSMTNGSGTNHPGLFL